MDKETQEILWRIGAFLSGGSAGAIITAICTARRETKSRRLSFIELVHRWRSEIERTNHRKPKDGWEAYLKRVGEFQGLLAKVRRDFTGRDFATATEALGSLRVQDVLRATGDPRNVICVHLDTLKRVCK